MAAKPNPNSHEIAILSNRIILWDNKPIINFKNLSKESLLKILKKKVPDKNQVSTPDVQNGEKGVHIQHSRSLFSSPIATSIISMTIKSNVDYSGTPLERIASKANPPGPSFYLTFF